MPDYDPGASTFGVNAYGMPHHMPDTSGMRQPARCAHCGGVYDLGTVTVTAVPW